MEIGNLRYLFGGVAKIAAVVIAVALVSVLIYSYFNRDNDVYGQLPKSYFQNLLAANTSWSTETFSLDSEAFFEVFKVTKRKISREDAWDMAKKLQLPAAGIVSLDEEKKEIYKTVSVNRELVISLDSGEVHFKDSGLTANLATSPIVNKEKALEAAKKTVSTLGIDTRLFNLDKPLYEFLKTAGHVHLQETIENEANLIYVSFPREIVGSRVVAPGGDDLLTLGVNNNYQIFSLSYSVLEIEDNQAVYKTLGESSVARKLRKGEGRLDHFVDTEESLTRPTLMIATKGEIVFYNDKHTPFVQPIYEIETLARSPVTDLQAKVYLPALNDNYFKN